MGVILFYKLRGLKMTIYEVVKKLIGSIKPYGETNIDKKRLDNLEYHKQLTESLILDLVDSAQFRKRKEYSMKKIGDRAYQELSILKNIIDRELEK